MSNDKNIYETPDETPEIDMIHLDEDYEVQAWCEMFSVTTTDLKRAIDIVGPSALKVKHYLNQKKINAGNAQI